MAELQARLAALLRRARLSAFSGSMAQANPQRLRVDASTPRAWLDGEAMELTQREWALLGLLVDHFGQVSNALEVYVHRLRRKLDHSGVLIRHVRGLGYLLEATVT